MEQDRPVLNGNKQSDSDKNYGRDNIPYLPHELISYILQLRSRIFSEDCMTKAFEKYYSWTELHEELILGFCNDYDFNTDTYDGLCYRNFKTDSSDVKIVDYGLGHNMYSKRAPCYGVLHLRIGYKYTRFVYYGTSDDDDSYSTDEYEYVPEEDMWWN